MNLAALLVDLILIGLVMWLVNSFIPMDARIKQILNVVVIIVVILWIVGLFGLLGPLNIPIRPVR